MDFVPFGDLYDIPSSNGLSRPSAVRGEGFKMINMGELFANDIIDDIEMERVQMSEREQAKYFVRKGDLLFARQSLVAEGAGKCSIVNNVDNETTFESHLIRVRLKKQYNPWFYYYLFQLKNNPIKAIVNQCAQAGIRGSELVKIKVPVISKSAQDNIVGVLSQYDSLIRFNNQRIKFLEQTAEEIYKEWFVRLRFPGYECAEFKKSIPKGWIYGNIENNSIPSSWHYGELSELGEFRRGKNITAAEMIEGNVPVISAGLEPSGYHNEANVFGRSITISASGANAGFLKYNLSDIWCADCSYYQSENNLWFMYSSLKFIQSVINNLQVGSAQPHVYPKNLNRLSIIIPERKYIEEYCSIVEPMFSEIDVLNRNNDNLTKQRDYLLPRLMSGKLEV